MAWFLMFMLYGVPIVNRYIIYIRMYVNLKKIYIHMYIYIMFAFRKKCWLYPIGPQSPTVSCCREASVLVVPDAAPTFTYRSNGGGSSHRSYLFYKPGEKCRRPPVSSNMAGKSPNEMRIQMGKSYTPWASGLIPEKYMGSDHG